MGHVGLLRFQVFFIFGNLRFQKEENILPRFGIKATLLVENHFAKNFQPIGGHIDGYCLIVIKFYYKILQKHEVYVALMHNSRCYDNG